MKSPLSLGSLLALSLLSVAACSRGETTDLPPGSGTAAAPTTYTLASGTPVDAALTDVINSRHAKAGETFTARVVDDVRSGTRIVIPAGSIVRGTIVEVSPAPNPNSTGTLTLAVTSVSVRGETYDLAASIDSLETLHEGRGIEAVDAARVAGGAAAGAIIGRVIGGNSTGTIVGGVAGGAIGAAVSVNMKDRDIVLPAGAHLMLTLQQPLTVAAR